MVGEYDSGTIQVGGDVSGQIGLGNSVVQAQSGQTPDTDESPITVLFWAANPVDTEPLRLDVEVRMIDERLRACEQCDRFDLRSHWAVRYSDLSEGLLRYRPRVVHFSGHGDPEGALVFEGADGSAHAVGVTSLADLFRIAGDDVRCVVFNACYSGAQAEAVAEHVDCVVGTTRAIEDRSALSFAAGFYRALGYGRSVESAFELGRTEIDLAGQSDDGVLHLHTRSGINADTVHIT